MFKNILDDLKVVLGLACTFQHRQLRFVLDVISTPPRQFSGSILILIGSCVTGFYITWVDMSVGPGTVGGQLDSGHASWVY